MHQYTMQKAFFVNAFEAVDIMSTASKSMLSGIDFECFQSKNLKFLKIKTLGFKPFLTHLSSKMILLEVAPQAPKNRVDKTRKVLSTV